MGERHTDILIEDDPAHASPGTCIYFEGWGDLDTELYAMGLTMSSTTHVAAIAPSPPSITLFRAQTTYTRAKKVTADPGKDSPSP